MKKILISTLLLSTSSAFADWNLKNDPSIYDLMYLSPLSKTTLDISYNDWKLDDLIVTSGTNKMYSLSWKSSKIVTDLTR